MPPPRASRPAVEMTWRIKTLISPQRRVTATPPPQASRNLLQRASDERPPGVERDVGRADRADKHKLLARVRLFFIGGGDRGALGRFIKRQKRIVSDRTNRGSMCATERIVPKPGASPPRATNRPYREPKPPNVPNRNRPPPPNKANPERDARVRHSPEPKPPIYSSRANKPWGRSAPQSRPWARHRTSRRSSRTTSRCARCRGSTWRRARCGADEGTHTRGCSFLHRPQTSETSERKRTKNE